MSCLLSLHIVSTSVKHAAQHLVVLLMAIEWSFGGTWLHVSVKVAMLVYVCKSLQDLMAPASDAGFWHQLGPVLHQLIQVAIL